MAEALSESRGRRTLVTLAWLSSLFTLLLVFALSVHGLAVSRLTLAALILLGAAGAAAAFGLRNHRPWAPRLAFVAFGALGMLHLFWFSLTMAPAEALRAVLNAAVLALLVLTSPAPNASSARP